ncbi:unnamed protein product [Ostreobium quekettii]|uniref:Uncharacterized protein n=1 Tax=Ostreobium quekettii TaxID=121088 RepID=A0A8S1IX20_9CHLO|nr:unnamed protein product [Ostreobium quekettii]
MLRQLYAQGFSDVYGDSSDQPATCFAAMQGDFSFVLYEEGYVLAARSHGGSQCPFSWGMLRLGQAGDALVLSSEPHEGLVDFSPGCYFETSAGDGVWDCKIVNYMRSPLEARSADRSLVVEMRSRLCGVVLRTQNRTEVLPITRL